MLALTVVFFAVAGALAWWRLEAGHPAQLWVTVWLIALGLFALRLFPYGELADRTLVLVAAATVAFAGATFVAPRLWAPRRPSRLGARQVELAAAMLLAAALLGCALFVAQAVRDAGLRNALLSSSDVRQSVQDGVYALTVKYVYFALAAAAMCGVAAGIVPERRWRWVLATAAAVLSTYFATGRSTVVITGMAATIAYLVAARLALPFRRLLLAAATAGLASLLVFSVMGQLIGKTFENSDLTAVRSFFTEHPQAQPLSKPYLYASAPIGALNVLVLRAPDDRTDGCAMLSAVCSALSHAGLPTRPLQRIRPFTEKPIPWNTYTALDDVIRDAGGNAIPVVFGLLGLLCGWLWTAARDGRVWAIAVYGVFSTAILTSAGSNTFAAPHVLGAIAIVLVSLVAAMMLPMRMTRR
jgi:hypothetical protein